MSEEEKDEIKRELEIIRGVSSNEEEEGEVAFVSGIAATMLGDIEFQIEQVINNPNLTDEEKQEKIKVLNIEKNKVLGLIK